MTNEDRFCGLPDTKACQACLITNVHTKYYTPSIMEWRRLWGKLLMRADRLLVFSDSSANILRKVYPELDLSRLEVTDPDYHPALAPIARAPRDGPLRIAVLGAMARHKGSQLVRRLAEYLISSKARILVFGPWSERGLPGNVRKFGPYAVANLGALMKREEVHVVLFPSVCPETFSYTLSEIFALELPVVSLDIGAQGERVRAYKYGVVTSGSSPAELVRALELASAKKREAIQAGATHG
jgi:glycosyltransferase involved in cell wall biosynthesis